MYPYHVIGHQRAALGETPVWCERTQSLLWVDIINKILWRYWPETGEILEHTLDVTTSAALLTEKSDIFLLVTQQGILLYDYMKRTSRVLCNYPEDPQLTRPNEAAIAPDGSLWFTTMDLQAKQSIGNWYRYQYMEPMPTRMRSHGTIPNTLVWFNNQIWFADTSEACFYCVNDNITTLSQATACHAKGATPDGSTITEQGVLINADWGTARLDYYQVGVFSLDWLGSITLPVMQPTSCTFGGRELTDLYVTSAMTGLTEPNEYDGALLRLNTQFKGITAHRFKLSLDY